MEGIAMKGRQEAEIRWGTANVFEDLGFPKQEAENLRLRSDLMTAILRLIEKEGLTQAAAATRLGVSQPRVSDLKRGKIERFSLDALVTMLGRAGIQVRLSLKRRPAA